MRPTIAFMMLLCLPMSVPAQDGSDSPEEAPTPEVTIIQGDDKTIAEYRIHGRLYMIKVTPRKGPPYYLVDTDGDGNLESRRGELSEDLLIPSWTLMEWN
ncbi:MAG: DUF2782 domain-containing protein [Gammaproteobacteria bacterium]|nr:DUF2782 domain-containing protein [Gammaproteobacteria bacterium]